MSTDKRKRGRPTGTGKNDNLFLQRVAELLIADPRLKPTTAIKRVIYKRADQSEQDVTLVRRLQGKWKVVGTELLQAARHRADQKAAADKIVPVRTGQRATSRLYDEAIGQLAITDTLSRMTRGLDISRSLQKAMNPLGDTMSKIMEQERRFRDLMDPPALRAMRELNERIERMMKPFGRF